MAKKGKNTQQIVDALNEDRAYELSAIIQYMGHHYEAAGMESPAIMDIFKQTSIDEMKHAEMLADRIVYLGGVPVQKPAKIMRGGNLKKMIGDDLDAEYDAIARYKRHIKLCADAADTTTRRMLEEILAQEEGHADTWETTLGVKK